jgi:hypothetical protein
MISLSSKARKLAKWQLAAKELRKQKSLLLDQEADTYDECANAISAITGGKP